MGLPKTSIKFIVNSVGQGGKNKPPNESPKGIYPNEMVYPSDKLFPGENPIYPEKEVYPAKNLYPVGE